MKNISGSDLNSMNGERDEVRDSDLSAYAKKRLLNQVDRLEQEAKSIAPILSEMTNILTRLGVERASVIDLLSYFMGNIFKPKELQAFSDQMKAWPAEMTQEDAIKALLELGAENKKFLRGLEEGLRRQYLPGKQIKRSPNFLIEARRKVGRSDCDCDGPEVSV